MIGSFKSFFVNYLLKPLSYVFVVLLSLYFLNMFSYFNFSLGSNNSFNSFEVIGTGKVNIIPNIAMTNFTIQEKGKTQEEARSAANTKQNQALSSLEKIGIKKEDIKTTGFYVNPNYENEVVPLQGQAEPAIYPPRNQVQNGYVAVITTEVKASKIELLNQAIDSLTTIGANVGGVSYTQDDREKYILQAQNKAIENAKVQAQDWAKSAGLRLGKVISIRNADDAYGYPQPYADSVALKSSPDTGTNLEPGTNEISARMGVSFEIKN